MSEQWQEDRLPPQNIEAEQAVLGAIFLEEESLVAASERLRRKIFTGRHISEFLKLWLSCLIKGSLLTSLR